MALPRVQFVSLAAARRLIDELSGRLNKEILPGLVIDVYELVDGRIILVDWESPKATVYPDIESLRVVLGEASTEPKHILAGVCPDGRQFPRRAKALVRACLAHFQVKCADWPSNQASVRTLDRFIIEELRDQDWWSEIWVPRIIACSGAVIQKATSGKWGGTKLAEDKRGQASFLGEMKPDPFCPPHGTAEDWLNIKVNRRHVVKAS